MGTRICRKYGVNGRGRVYNLQSGREIPEDEPVLLFRAQDCHLPRLLEQYAAMCQNEAHSMAIHARRAEVMEWQDNCPAKIKEPDTDFSDYERDPVGEAMDGVLGRGFERHETIGAEERAAGVSAQDSILNLRERSPRWLVTVRGPELTGRHDNVMSTKVDEAGYLHLEIEGSEVVIYNRTEWACITKEPQHA